MTNSSAPALRTTTADRARGSDPAVLLSTVPAPVRSTPPVPGPQPGQPLRPYRLHGAVLSGGALFWAAAIAVVGTDPVPGAGAVLFAFASGSFQIGLFFLLRAMWRSRALGTGRLARGWLVAENVVLGLAVCSTVVDGMGVSDLDQTGWLLLDLCWPLSMLGMFTLAVRIAWAGRWSGLARVWPLVAESWALVTVPSTLALGPEVGAWVGAVHLLVGYTVLGRILARKVD